jgi:hypothetical protein
MERNIHHAMTDFNICQSIFREQTEEEAAPVGLLPPVSMPCRGPSKRRKEIRVLALGGFDKRAFVSLRRLC